MRERDSVKSQRGEAYIERSYSFDDWAFEPTKTTRSFASFRCQDEPSSLCPCQPFNHLFFFLFLFFFSFSFLSFSFFSFLSRLFLVSFPSLSLLFVVFSFSLLFLFISPFSPLSFLFLSSSSQPKHELFRVFQVSGRAKPSLSLPAIHPSLLFFLFLFFFSFSSLSFSIFSSLSLLLLLPVILFFLVSFTTFSLLFHFSSSSLPFLFSLSSLSLLCLFSFAEKKLYIFFRSMKERNEGTLYWNLWMERNKSKWK